MERGLTAEKCPAPGREEGVQKGAMVDYEIAGGVLKVLKQLDNDYDISFDRACSDLVASPEREIAIDLTHVRSITSTYIGLMAAAFFMAKSQSKNMSIIAQGQVLHVLRISGFEAFMPIIDHALKQ